jgi:hypothetical protein
MSFPRVCIVCAVLLAAAQAQEVGSLAGTVVDLLGAVIPGAQLRLLGIKGEVARVRSGADGEFRFPNLLPGIYSIEVTAPGLVAQGATELRVYSGEIAGVVEGSVPSPAGARAPVWGPPENVLITAIGPILLTEAGPKSGNLADSTRTDKKGHFNLSIREPGRYTVTAHQDGHADFIVEDVAARRGLRTTILWTLPLRLCPTADRCEPVREFPPLICM